MTDTAQNIYLLLHFGFLALSYVSVVAASLPDFQTTGWAEDQNVRALVVRQKN